MSPRTGRPISEGGPKDKLLQVRVDEKTLETLDECANTTKTTRSTVVREAIEYFSEKVIGKKGE